MRWENFWIYIATDLSSERNLKEKVQERERTLLKRKARRSSIHGRARDGQDTVMKKVAT